MSDEWAQVTAARYDRIILVLVPAFVISQYALYRLMHAFWKPRLTTQALEHYGASKALDARGKQAFMREASGCVWNCVFHTVFGSTAMYSACALLGSQPAQALGDYQELLVSGEATALELQEVGALLGSVFAALMVHFTFYWFCRWDTDPLQLFHHFAFIGVSVVLARRSAMPFVGLFAMAMECSSPALAVMTLLRQLEGELYQRISFVATVSFGLLFMASRVFMFGYALLSTLRVRFFTLAPMPSHVPGWEFDLVLFLLTCGWVLQLHWARLIVRKFRRHMRKADGKSS
mmetsp:Transcript_54922/g.119797  ORF Transcript_54922/g.119797 Transcript_54922/m.119797 type:complete len:290 (+) Transcript_54922:465-1334(+)